MTAAAAVVVVLPDHHLHRRGLEMGFLDFVEADDDFDGIHENLFVVLFYFLVLNLKIVDKDEVVVDDDDGFFEDLE